jgi:putative DNA primase/helicase
MIDVHAIAAHYGGEVCKGNALIPTPGHSKRDRGTAIKPNPFAPDGVLVACYNGSTADALAVKEILRRDGFITSDVKRKPRSLTVAERRAIRQAVLTQKRERLAREKMAAANALSLWNNSPPANAAHAYLVSKGLAPFGIRQSGDKLLVPMVDAGFCLWNVQRIYPNGFKRFLPDCRTTGLFWNHGARNLDGRPADGPIVIGEGFGTMAAIYMATGHEVVAAMSAHNLETVARIIRKFYPSRDIVIAADDDSHMCENLGLLTALKAAQAIGGRLATPRPHESEGGIAVDFADIPRDQVKARIAAAQQGG